MHVFSKAGAKCRFTGIVDHLDRAGFAIDPEAQLIHLSGRRARRLDRPDRPIGEIDIHRKAVIRIKIIFADLVARRLVEGLQPREDMGNVKP